MTEHNTLQIDAYRQATGDRAVWNGHFYSDKAPGASLMAFVPVEAVRALNIATGIEPGSDADIVIFDPEKKIRLSVRTLHMNVDYNPYEGREVTGVTETVVSRGRVIVDNGTFVGRAGAGSFLRRQTR